jgi:hypothetical protein
LFLSVSSSSLIKLRIIYVIIIIGVIRVFRVIRVIEVVKVIRMGLLPNGSPGFFRQ